MRSILRSGYLLIGMGIAFSIAAQPGDGSKRHWEDPPKLVVGIVIDQMRTDLIYRYWRNFGEGGFKRAIGEGSFQRDAHFDYVPTYTGPGHASIYTGTTPAFHGIVGNDLFLRATGGGLYCAEDAEVTGVGCTGRIGQRSPVNLMSTTLADELERRTERRSRTIGIALKDRGAILPIGRTGDAAYWFGAGEEGHFVTSTWYGDTLPAWLQEFNAEEKAKEYLSGTWDLLLPRERYQQVLPDDNPYEKPMPGARTATLPQDLAAISKGNTGVIAFTPWGNTLTTDMAIAAIAGEQLGTDAITDLLAVSYSSPDMAGHYMGIRSLELEDMYIGLDRDLARLFDRLDEVVGNEEYLVFITADHGAGDVPAYLKDLRGSAGSFDQSELIARIETMLDDRYGEADWVLTITNGQVFLNEKAIDGKQLDHGQIQRKVADLLLTDPLIATALSAIDLVSRQYTEGPQRAIQRGFMPQRCGDVCFSLQPGILDAADVYEVGKGSAHASAWNYDTHVPVIFFGKGVAKGEVHRRTSITDIVPTVAMLVGMTVPDASIGRVVPEVITR